MARYDFSAPRLFIDTPLAKEARWDLDRAQSNYLINVLRLRADSNVLVFNGTDGEWLAKVVVEGRKSATLVVAEQTRLQTSAPDLIYLFAPIKHARQDYMVQKAVEMGVGGMRPVFTRRTQSGRVNIERMRANAIEAAEQCGILTIPQILPERQLGAALAELEADRLVIFCDEDAPVADPVEALRVARNHTGGTAIIIGPEGGFTDEERALINARKPNLRISLGPRILRADTAAVAALALVQSVFGDWTHHIER